MKVLIFGASGIIGQHMRLCVPDGVEPVWYRKTADPITRGADITRPELRRIFTEIGPDVVINLAGESSPDKVQADPHESWVLNVTAAGYISALCEELKCHCVHISTQAVFDGLAPPYSPDSKTIPVNEYGDQKRIAEVRVLKYRNALVIRPTFILGIRPLPHVGRKNPLEGMLDVSEFKQTYDRWFSPLFAQDAARLIWEAVLSGETGKILHLGIPEAWSRFEIANQIHSGFEPVPQADWEGTANRPLDTTYAQGSRYFSSVREGLRECQEDSEGKHDRAIEIALFMGITRRAAEEKLARGFGALHQEVTDDFNRAGAGASDESLIEWYRTTEAYIWELSAYHDDPGFNYGGMCAGIANRLRGKLDVLCLGDGIGDMTLALKDSVRQAWYHDLPHCRTAQYAYFRYWRQTGEKMLTRLMLDWSIGVGTCSFDAICSADFLEHVLDVEQWVRTIHKALVPGGLFFAQNAFACGSGPSGSMPMHLARNDRFEKDWDPLLSAVGFEQLSSNWYRKR